MAGNSSQKETANMGITQWSAQHKSFVNRFGIRHATESQDHMRGSRSWVAGRRCKCSGQRCNGGVMCGLLPGLDDCLLGM